MTTKGERTRRRLIDVAMARFERDGFGSTTMRTIATEAGVSVGLTCRCFDAREGLVLAFDEQAAEALARRPVEGVTLGGPLRARDAAQARAVGATPARDGCVDGCHAGPGRSSGGAVPGPGHGAGADPGDPRGGGRWGRERVPGAGDDPGAGGLGGHLLLWVAWVQRPEATEGLLAQVGAGLDMAVPWLGGPMAQLALGAVAQALAPLDPEG